MIEREFLDRMYHRLREARASLAHHKEKRRLNPPPLVKVGRRMVEPCDAKGAALECWEAAIDATLNDYLRLHQKGPGA